MYRVVATDTWYDSGGEGKPSCFDIHVLLRDTEECSEAIVRECYEAIVRTVFPRAIVR